MCVNVNLIANPVFPRLIYISRYRITFFLLDSRVNGAILEGLGFLLREDNMEDSGSSQQTQK